MSSSGVNHFEAQARARKVAKLAQAIDDAASFCGLDPKRDGFAIADMVANLPQSRWLDIVRDAGFAQASKTTRDALVAHYRERGGIAQQRVAS